MDNINYKRGKNIYNSVLGKNRVDNCLLLNRVIGLCNSVMHCLPVTMGRRVPRDLSHYPSNTSVV